VGARILSQPCVEEGEFHHEAFFSSTMSGKAERSAYDAPVVWGLTYIPSYRYRRKCFSYQGTLFVGRVSHAILILLFASPNNYTIFDFVRAVVSALVTRIATLLSYTSTLSSNLESPPGRGLRIILIYSEFIEI